MKKRFGPPPAMTTEEALIARDEHRQGGQGAAWIREKLTRTDEHIAEYNSRPVDSRLDSPTA